MKTYSVEFNYRNFIRGTTHVYARTWIGAKIAACRRVGMKNTVTYVGDANFGRM